MMNVAREAIYPLENPEYVIHALNSEPHWRFKPKHGERSGSSYHVFMKKKAHDIMVQHTLKSLDDSPLSRHEVGGALIGQVFVDSRFPIHFAIIEHVIPCEECPRTPMDITFTAEFWKRVDIEVGESVSALRLGTYHSHPGYGVFLSNQDKRMLLSTFRSPHHITMVIDPVVKQIGAWVWNDDIAEPTHYDCVEMRSELPASS